MAVVESQLPDATLLIALFRSLLSVFDEGFDDHTLHCGCLFCGNR